MFTEYPYTDVHQLNLDWVLKKIKYLENKINSGGGSGENGATFTPSVSPQGIISWTNDKGLPNPAPVNIMGPQGPTGATGPQGPAGDDYVLTNQDKQDIADIVIADLPVWTGGSY